MEKIWYTVSLLKKFNVDLPKVTKGIGMFTRCPGLEEFGGALPNLESGYRMFPNCENLKRFRSALPKLKDGRRMFSGCQLDLESLRIIADSIPLVPSDHSTYEGKLHIGLGSLTAEEEVQKNIYLNQMAEKGWSVTIE